MEKRSVSRILVKTPCKARFQLGGQAYTNIQVVNLGSHGCCFVIPVPAVNRFKAGPILEDWKLIHPKLPRAAIKAKVVWCRPQGEVKLGFLEAGVQFMDVPPSYSEELDRFLMAALPVLQPATPVASSNRGKRRR
jgi:hypothetical protein